MPPKAAPKSERTIARPVLETRDQAAAAEAAGPVSLERETDLLEALAPEGSIVLNGREFTLSPWRLRGLKLGAQRFGSMRAFQAALVTLLPPVLADGEGGYTYDFDSWDPDLDVLQFCVWLGLQRKHPELDVADLEDLLPARDIDLVNVIGKVMHVAALDDPQDPKQEGSSDPPA